MKIKKVVDDDAMHENRSTIAQTPPPSYDRDDARGMGEVKSE